MAVQLCMGCLLASQLTPQWSVLVQSEFIFRVEGTGVLPVEGVILTAVDVLEAKLRNLQQALPPDEVEGEN